MKKTCHFSVRSWQSICDSRSVIIWISPILTISFRLGVSIQLVSEHVSYFIYPCRALSHFCIWILPFKISKILSIVSWTIKKLTTHCISKLTIVNIPRKNIIYCPPIITSLGRHLAFPMIGLSANFKKSKPQFQSISVKVSNLKQFK